MYAQTYYGNSKMTAQTCSETLLVINRISAESSMLIYKYNILERVLVENIIPTNVIINRGALSQECYIYFSIPNIISVFSNHRARSSKDNVIAMND